MRNILFEFLSKLYLFKQENKDFKITVELKTNEHKRNQLKNESVEITKDNLPQLNTEKFPENDFFATRELLYDITKVNDKKVDILRAEIHRQRQKPCLKRFTFSGSGRSRDQAMRSMILFKIQSRI